MIYTHEVKGGYTLKPTSSNELDNLVKDGSIILLNTVEGESINVDDNHNSASSGILILAMVSSLTEMLGIDENGTKIIMTLLNLQRKYTLLFHAHLEFLEALEKLYF